MTVIVPEINTRTSVEKIVSPPATGIITNGFEEWKDDETPDNDTITNLPQCLDEETSFTATIKSTSDSISMVFSKNKTPHKKETSMANGSVFPGSGMKVVSRGRRRSVDKQYKPTQPTNSGGSRGSTRRSGRYQNYDNNSSNGNSGADGNGEDNDDSDDDDDDEYIDEDDDDEEEDEEEEEEEEDDEDNKNEEEDEDETANGRDKTANSMDSINEKLLSSLNIKGSDDTSVVMMNSGTSEMTLAPAPSGTPVNLEGVIYHETMGGVLVVNIKWRNKIYCGSLMDCTRHSWARPRFQSSDSSNQGKTRLGKNNGRGKGKGRGRRLRNESVNRDNANNHTVSPLKQKLRGRKKTMSGSSTDKRTGFRSSKRKAKNNDDDSDDSIRPGKRSCTMKGAPSPQPSPTLIECPEPGCEKKYKHINGLRYHQAHAHLESKTQDDDANSDDRSSTTPSPSDEFKEPDPRITTKGRASSRNRSESPSITQDKNNTNIDKDVSNTEADKKPKNEPIKDEDEPANLWDAEPEKKPDDNEVVDKNQKEEPKKEEHIDDKSNTIDVNESPEENGEVCDVKTQEHSIEGEFVEVADKSTDTRMMNSTGESKEVTSYPCDKHTGISLEMVIPASEVPEVADTQEVCVTVLDSGCISNTKYEESGSVNIDDVISSQSEAMDDNVKLEKAESQDFGKESEVDSVFDYKDDRRQIMLTTGSINQLGIEVEDISENEEDIDPGQDTEFNSREEMEKAVENLQTGSFVASMSTENNLQMLSSLKDPSLIFGLTNRDKTSEDGATTTDTSRTEDIFSILPRNRQLNDEDADQITENSIDSELEVATRPLIGVAGENRDDSKISADSVPSLSAKSEHETLEKSFSNSPSSMSVENLVSRSISASKLQPPLTNTDTPSSRFKYFTCRSYGDEAYSRTASNITNTNAVTTLALIRDPDLIKQDNLSEKNANSIDLQAATMNTHKDPVASVVENVGPSYTGSAGFDRDCTTSSIHTRGPKEEHKGESFMGDIIRSKNYGSTGNLSVDKQRRNESSSKVSFSSPKSAITTTATTYNLQQYSPKSEESNSIKKDSNDDVGWVNLEKESSNQSNEGDVSSALSEGTGDEGKKDGDREKSSSRMFLRQPPTLIPKHSRPTPPILPVGVAHPYQYSTVATSAAVTTGLSVTSPGRQELCRPEPVCHNTPSKPDTELESKPPILKKVVAEKAHPIPVGEVGPVAVKRPAIHAGLPTVIPAGAPVLKSQGSLHTSIRQGLKPPGQEERASTPGGLSSRLSGSPRPMPSSPRPLSTSPRLPLPKAKISENKSSTANESLSSSSSSEKSVKDTDTDVVIVKEEHEPASDKGSSIDAEKIKDRKRSPYQSSKVQLTTENYMYQLQQRQMYQAGMELAYMPPFASPWHLSMSPKQIKLLQQHHYRMRAEEETREISKNPKEDPNKLRMEKRESSSSIERRTASEGRTTEQVVRSTPPRPERRLITGISSPSEVSRSSTSDGLNRGVPRLTQVDEPPEKKMRAEYSKSDDAERELQKLRHKRQEEYLSKQSMQHKFTMFKQLESGGGAAKTHSIPPLTTTNKDRLGEREDDYPKSKYTQLSPHGESLQPRTQETSKVTTSNEANSSDSSKSRDTNRDSSRDTHLKPTSKHTWTSSSSSSSSRLSDTPPSERTSSSFRPTQFQAYLQHNQMIEPMNYDPATGNPVLIQTSMALMSHQLPMELGGAMNLSSTSVITSSVSTPTSVPSRLKERERLSPYRGTNVDQSPSSSSHSHSRSSRSRSPGRDASPKPSSHSKSTYSRNNDRPRSPLSHARSPYKTPDKTPSSSPSVVSSSHLHRSGGERMSSTATVGSRSSHRNSERSSSPLKHSHKESYRVPTSSPSRSSVFNRGDRSASPPRSQAHNEYRFKQRSESSSNTVSTDSLSKAKTAHEDPGYRGQERRDAEAALQLRPGIISNNLAVRRGDVTPSMLMVTPAQEEELIRRHHHYMLYMQQQEQAAYAMMSSNQQNAPRSGSYYAKRQ